MLSVMESIKSNTETVDNSVSQFFIKKT